MSAIYKDGEWYGKGGGSEYDAGNGIAIENNEISTDNMPAEDMEEVVTPLPGVMSRRMKYSTDEQVIGEWIDGKPIYQKTFIKQLGSTSSNTWEDVADLPNVDTVICYSGSVGEDNFMLGTNYFANPQVDKTRGKLQVFHLGMANKLFKVTVQYTKTTD